MAKPIVNRSQAAVYLQGRWTTAVLVQVICLCAELLLIVAEGMCLYRFPDIPFLPISLVADLLLLSPLKAGRAFFYETLVTDGGGAKVKLLFQFYRYGYPRSIGWRLGLWIRRTALHIVLCVPSAIFLYISRVAEQAGSETFAMISFVLSLVFLVIALTAAEILLFRYIPAAYLLTQVVSAKHALSLSKRLSKGYTSKWTLLYLDYAGWCFSMIVLVPFFYVSPLFHTARAATAKRLFSGISPQIRQQLLQRRKNHGKIRNEF